MVAANRRAPPAGAHQALVERPASEADNERRQHGNEKAVKKTSAARIRMKSQRATGFAGSGEVIATL
jgi:hypothetical protein